MFRPSVRQLECAVAVADHGTFRAAASACFVTQPALSAQIAALEEQLGGRLFERARPRALPTPLGAAFVLRARDALAEIDAMVEAARGLTRPFATPLRLGVIPTLAPFLLPRALPRIRRRHPELRLLLREERTADLVEAVRGGALDGALLALEADLGDLATLPLFEDRFLLAVARGHALDARRRVRERDLAGEEVLLLEEGHCMRDQVLSVCRRARAPEVADVRAGSLATLIEMVAGGMGITLLPEMATWGRRPLPADLVVRPLAAPVPARTIGLAWRARSARQRDLELLAPLLRAAQPAAGRVGDG